MLKVSVLSTSSAGNCSFVSDGTSRLLIDCGLAMYDTTHRLKAIGEDVDQVDAVLLTHSHSDHAFGLHTLIKRWRRGGRHVPVFCSASTFEELPNVIPPHWYREIAQQSYWNVAGIRCETFAVPHDTGEPLGFTCASDGLRATFALDLGWIDAPLGEYLAGADILLLESNHDSDMLQAGPYSYLLKQRIAQTHLSNEAACKWIQKHMTARTRHLLLGHLSMTTNDLEIVRLMASQAIEKRGLAAALEVIPPGGQPSGPLILEPRS